MTWTGSATASHPFSVLVGARPSEAPPQGVPRACVLTGLGLAEGAARAERRGRR